MSLTHSQKVVLLIGGAVVVAIVLVIMGVIPGLRTTTNDPHQMKAALTVWGVYDNQDAYSGALQNFATIYPNVTVTYRRFSNPSDYNSALLDALAAGTGPDIFMIRNTDTPRQINKILPANSASLSLLQLKQLFPQVVTQDFYRQNNVYGLPFSIDTLALFYNRNIFDQAGLPLPGTWQSWEDFLDTVPKLVTKDAKGAITEAGAAIGGNDDTIPTASDLLSLLMLQNGSKIGDQGAPSFTGDLGIQALTFYTQFADPNSKAYTWNDSMQNARDAFGQGKVAMIFDYASSLPELKARNAYLNFEVAPVPQPKNAATPVAFPDYWGYVVSRQTKYPTIAWDFILQAATNATVANEYAVRTGKPPALNSLLYQYQNDPTLSVFARQALIARSWDERDKDAARTIFSQMIHAVVVEKERPIDALGAAQNAVNQIIQRSY